MILDLAILDACPYASEAGVGIPILNACPYGSEAGVGMPIMDLPIMNVLMCQF